MGINSDRIPLTVKLRRETYLRLRDTAIRMQKPGDKKVTHQDFIEKAVEAELKKRSHNRAS